MISEEEIEQEIEGWRTSTNLGRELDDLGRFYGFETGFKAGVSFACRMQVDVPCFCGCHISEVCTDDKSER